MKTRILYEEIDNDGDILRYERSITTERKDDTVLGTLLSQVLLSCVNTVDWGLSLSFSDMLENIRISIFEHNDTPEIQHILGLFMLWKKYSDMANGITDEISKDFEEDEELLMNQFFDYVKRFKFDTRKLKRKQHKETT